MRSKIILLIAFLVLTSLAGQAQSLKELNELEKRYNTCLDKGTNMAGCSLLYYNQMDSLLNVTYNKVRQPLSQNRKAALKNEQIQWLQKRNVYFKQIDKEYSSNNSNGLAGADSRMMAIEEKAQFVKRRVEELIKKLKSS